MARLPTKFFLVRNVYKVNLQFLHGLLACRKMNPYL
uniref:Uncharacterized protein n=1 Tax=Arundo donax TaxID=35708 RepID=A0A0A9BVX5_ARUDO